MVTDSIRMDSQDPIVIIGAGIVGACCAAWLQRDGQQVLLLDRKGAGEGASYGNAGCLNGSSVVPVGLPGMMFKVPGWLIDPLGPLAIRPAYLPRLLPWLWHFWRASSADRVTEIARALRPMIRDSLANYQPIVQAAGAAELIERKGTLFAYTTQAGRDADRYPMQLRADAGVAITELDGPALHALEPDLAGEFIGARLIEENGHCTNPGLLTRKIVDHVIAQGGALRIGQVCGFDLDGAGGVAAVRTDAGVHRASAVVLAAGAWSRPLAAQLGDEVPLDTERGYHLVIADPEVMPRIPTLWTEGKVIATPMQMGLRFASMVEFAGLDAAPNWARADRQLRLGQQMYPGLARQYAEDRLSRWLGFRPSMPDSMPVIGRASAARNAFHAFGHGHIGLVSASTTGRAIADLVAGRVPCMPIDAFSPARYRRGQRVAPAAAGITIRG
jgi:D-amino-acid dehydrogenase